MKGRIMSDVLAEPAIDLKQFLALAQEKDYRQVVTLFLEYSGSYVHSAFLLPENPKKDLNTIKKIVERTERVEAIGVFTANIHELGDHFSANYPRHDFLDEKGMIIIPACTVISPIKDVGLHKAEFCRQGELIGKAAIRPTDGTVLSKEFCVHGPIVHDIDTLLCDNKAVMRMDPSCKDYYWMPNKVGFGFAKAAHTQYMLK